MPKYVIQNVVGDATSGVKFGEAINSKIPAGALISPPSYDALKDQCGLTLVIDAGDVRVMTMQEKAAIPASSLALFKEHRKAEIDAKTDSLLAVGFEYPSASGVFFDIVEPARTRWIGIKQAADAGALTTVTIRDKNRNPFVLATVTDIGNFWGVALTFELNITGAGGALLDAIEAATDASGVEAVVDNR